MPKGNKFEQFLSQGEINGAERSENNNEIEVEDLSTERWTLRAVGRIRRVEQAGNEGRDIHVHVVSGALGDPPTAKGDHLISLPRYEQPEKRLKVDDTVFVLEEDHHFQKRILTTSEMAEERFRFIRDVKMSRGDAVARLSSMVKELKHETGRKDWRRRMF